jgi:ABC-2 type transport system ATP-binding protein
MIPAIEINNLTKEYSVGFIKKRRISAISNISLTVGSGEIFGFLGANGTGKTTTIKLLMRLIYPTSGSAKILGQDINDISMHKYIGYLPEQPYFYDYLTARELLEYFAEIFGYSHKERRERASNLLSRVHLDEKHWDKQLRKFSKGMLQRVGLAQALINDPKVLFLDEPMSGLDPIGRREVRDLISSLRASGVTVFFSSHILSDIEILCDRIAIIKNGQLAYTGRLEDLRQKFTDNGHMEILASRVELDQLRIMLAEQKDVFLTETASGIRIHIPSENHVDEVLAAIRTSGGKLISVQPTRQSLEDLFFYETNAS